MKKENICVLIVSFDKYIHLAELNFLSINKYWKDLKYDIFYLSNLKDFSNNYNKINSLKVGKDYSWSKSLKIALDKLSKNYNYVLTIIDDLILNKCVDSDDVEFVIENFIKENGNCLKLINKPKPNSFYNNLYGKVNPRNPYRTTTVFTVWKIDLLKSILVDNENAWDFEKKGRFRVMKKEGFYSVYKSLFYFKNTVVKGKYQWGFNKIIKDINGEKVVIPKINYFNFYDYLKRAFLKLRHKIYMFLLYRIINN